jgi:hypothetical protein
VPKHISVVGYDEDPTPELFASKPDESHKRSFITSIEFTLKCPIAEFDEEKFNDVLKLATGIDNALRIGSG